MLALAALYIKLFCEVVDCRAGRIERAEQFSRGPRNSECSFYHRVGRLWGDRLSSPGLKRLRHHSEL